MNYGYTSAFAQGDFTGALRQVLAAMETSPADGRLWNDAGVMCYRMHRSQQAVEYFENALRLTGDAPDVRSNLIKARNAAGRFGGKKIAFFCGADGPTFLGDIYAYLKRFYEVRFFEGQSKESLHELMQWSDISWFEWATNLAAVGLSFPKVCRTIVRLHRYEAYVGWCEQMDWNKVDALITVGNPSVMEQIHREVPGLEHRTRIHVIPNGVNLDRFAFVPRERGKNLAFVANLREVKNPMLLLQCMAALCDKDPHYQLFLAGRSTDAALEQYLRHTVRAMNLEKNVHFQDWQDDINAWLRDKHYIISTSIIESQGMGILEGMARGLKPVVHNYPGAAAVFAPEFVFTRIEEFCGHILAGDYEPRRYREFVETRYPLKRQLEQIQGILTDMELDLDAEKEKSAYRAGPVKRPVIPAVV